MRVFAPLLPVTATLFGACNGIVGRAPIEHLAPIALTFRRWTVAQTPPVIDAAFCVGIFPSIVSFLCFNRSTELIGPARAGQYMHLTPAFGSLLAVIFLD